MIFVCEKDCITSLSMCPDCVSTFFPHVSICLPVPVQPSVCVSTFSRMFLSVCLFLFNHLYVCLLFPAYFYLSACSCSTICMPAMSFPISFACNRLAGLVIKATASRATDPGFDSRLRRDFSGSSFTSGLKNWHSSGYPARRLAL